MNTAPTIKGQSQNPVRWFWLCTVGLLISLISAIYGRGNILHFMFVVDGLFYIGLPVMLVTTVLAIQAHRSKSTRLKAACLRFLGVVIILLLQLPGLLLGTHFAATDTLSAERFCESLVPKLEAWKQSNGIYPEKIEQVVQNASSLPRLLRGTSFYQSAGTNFEFTVPDSPWLIRAKVYESEHKSWMVD
jgi:hypothetical protein